MNKSYFPILFSIFILVLSCKNSPCDPDQNYVVFDDINLENLIRETLNKPTGEITKLDMQSILVLRGFQYNIEKLKGIEHCANLKELYLGDNEIEDISPLSNLSELQNLSLHFNKVTDLDHLKNLGKLQALVLADNNISDIGPLVNLTDLNFLKVGGNEIIDMQPLVQNIGIGSGDIINIVDNPLSETSLNVYIPELEARGVRLYY